MSLVSAPNGDQQPNNSDACVQAPPRHTLQRQHTGTKDKRARNSPTKLKQGDPALGKLMTAFCQENESGIGPNGDQQPNNSYACVQAPPTYTLRRQHTGTKDKRARNSPTKLKQGDPALGKLMTAFCQENESGIGPKRRSAAKQQ